jgi:hypothetical protein
MPMRLVLVVAYLDRAEWTADTAWASVRYAFELLVRGLAGDTGRALAAHVALHFEDVEDADMLRRVAPYVDEPVRDFFVDVLATGKHTVSLWDDPKGWWGGWRSIRAEFYTVLGVDDAGIKRAFNLLMDIVESGERYDGCVNLNSVLYWPCRCRPWLLCGGTGLTCVSAVVRALAAARNPYERGAERALGIPRQKALAARLPRVLVRELIRAGVLFPVPHVLSRGGASDAQLPLLRI